MSSRIFNEDAAAAIILSGTGTDGTLGARAIKANDGLMFRDLLIGVTRFFRDAELQSNVEELSATHDDMRNLLNST